MVQFFLLSLPPKQKDRYNVRHGYHYLTCSSIVTGCLAVVKHMEKGSTAGTDTVVGEGFDVGHRDMFSCRYPGNGD